MSELPDIKVEKDVPVPSQDKDPLGLGALEVGDSFLWPIKKQTAIRYHMKKHQFNNPGKKFITRTVDDYYMRIWRTK